MFEGMFLEFGAGPSDETRHSLNMSIQKQGK